MRIRIIELNGSDASKVVQISRDLIVRRRRWKASMTDKKICLGDMRDRDVVPKEECGNSSLNILVLSKGGRS